jgi:nucleoid DNA-binding protein
MNKAQLVELVLKDKKAGFESRAAAERAVNTTMDSIVDCVKSDGKVQFDGIGTFSSAQRNKTTDGPEICNFTIGNKASQVEHLMAWKILRYASQPHMRSLFNPAVLDAIRTGVKRDSVLLASLTSYSISSHMARTGRWPQRPRTQSQGPKTVIIRIGPILQSDSNR